MIKKKVPQMIVFWFYVFTSLFILMGCQGEAATSLDVNQVVSTEVKVVTSGINVEVVETPTITNTLFSLPPITRTSIITLELQILKFELTDQGVTLIVPPDSIIGVDFDTNSLSSKYDINYSLDTSGSGRYETLSHAKGVKSLFFNSALNAFEYCQENKAEVQSVKGNTLTKAISGLGFCVLTDEGNFVVGHVANMSDSTNGSSWVELEYTLYNVD